MFSKRLQNMNLISQLYTFPENSYSKEISAGKQMKTTAPKLFGFWSTKCSKTSAIFKIECIFLLQPRFRVLNFTSHLNNFHNMCLRRTNSHSLSTGKSTSHTLSPLRSRKRQLALVESSFLIVHSQHDRYYSQHLFFNNISSKFTTIWTNSNRVMFILNGVWVFSYTECRLCEMFFISLCVRGSTLVPLFFARNSRLFGKQLFRYLWMNPSSISNHYFRNHFAQDKLIIFVTTFNFLLCTSSVQTSNIWTPRQVR